MRYRIHTLNRLGNFIAVEEIDCASDEDAVLAAKQRLGLYDLEVWWQNRRITRLSGSASGDNR
jgi:hypothetical protein